MRSSEVRTIKYCIGINSYDSNYLSHHGILGMKWGKRNGPPYPLGSSQHSASEKKAGWQKSLSAKPRRSLRGNPHRSSVSKKAKEVDKKAEEHQNSFGRKLNLTDKQKRAIKIGAVAVGSALAIAGAVYISKTIKSKNIESDKIIDAINTVDTIDEQIPRIGKSIKQIDEELVHSINNLKSRDYVGIVDELMADEARARNCTQTSTAYLLNTLFGIKCTAKPTNNVSTIIDEKSGAVLNGRNADFLLGMCDGVKKHTFTRHIRGETYAGDKSLLDAFKEIPNGSTGAVTVPGHILNYEKDLNGAVTMIDCQSGEITPLPHYGFAFHSAGVCPVGAIYDFSEAVLKDNARDIFKYLVDEL